MIHAWVPLVPVTVAGAVLSRRKGVAYGLPVALTLVKVWLTEPSLVYVFTGGGLLASVWAIRRLKASWGASIYALSGYSGLSIGLYELISNFGVWILAGCLPEQPALYPMTASGLLACYRAAIPFAALHLVRDLPLAVLATKAAAWLGRRGAPATLLKHEAAR